MRNLNFLLLSTFFVFLTSCSSQLIRLDNGKQIDRRLVGTWVGSESDQQIEGVDKNWEMERKADGTFNLDFNFTQDGEHFNSVESGNWWIEGGKFYEFHEDSGDTDIYSYKVLDKNQIEFKSENISVEMNTEAYTFIDRRKAEDARDGLSFETAIKVKSVPEEYQYLLDHCNQCEVVSQSLNEYKGGFYDVLKVNKPDGTTVNYYFDIKSFFGKF